MSAVAGLAVLLMAMGMALRPVLISDEPTRQPVLNATEIGFVQDMVTHHSQALMLVQRLDPGVEPSVATLADQIADSQRTELGMLLGWLRLAGAPVTAPHPMAWMQQSGAHPHRAAAASPDSAMPGMATTAELDQLAAARGPQAEALFLRLMQRHHYGGIEMAAAADALLTGGEVERTARGMLTEQGREAGLLDLLLARRSG
ncbi:DUF305 domain-containing protein [Nocardia sp. NPDC058518]|uniref:DUF305 domain-containing protein n=1 Tax=Nocardia sp. NPDC058518 TaxID=3346534 RepID=UPI00365FD0F7